MEKRSNYAQFLFLIQIIVDNAPKDHPKTKLWILRACEKKYNMYIGERTFDTYIRHMGEGGIVIKHGIPEGCEGGPHVYWYESGWI